MKNKVSAESGQCFQTILPLGCWTPVYKRKQKVWQRADSVKRQLIALWQGRYCVDALSRNMGVYGAIGRVCRMRG